MKKLMSLALAIVLCISCLPMPANAFELNATDDAGLIRATAEIQRAIPDADITVENGTIHVVVNDISDIPGFEHYSAQASSSLPTSNVGGSYRNFRNVILADFYPYSQVYMSQEVTAAMVFYLDHPDQFYQILQDALEGATYLYIKAQLTTYYKQVYGDYLSDVQTREIALTASGIAEFATDSVIAIAKSSFKSAANNSSTGKVSIVRGYTDTGYHITYYSAWNDNLIPTFNGYNADWYEGIFDVST